MCDGPAAEVIVAGAGPAGAVAARTLAAAGVDTLLVDRAEFPRNKPCGGGMTVRATRRFPWLRTALAGVDVHAISRLHLEGPGGAAFDVEGRDPFVLTFRRVEFDAALVNAAVAAGARMLAPVEITQVEETEAGVRLRSRDGRHLSAPMVIAADGVHSVLGKRLGVNPIWPATSIALDMMEEAPTATLCAERPDVLWVAYAPEGLDGYAYVFPKRHHVNVGIGCLLSQYRDLAPGPPYALQRRLVDSLVGRGVLTGRSDRRFFTPYLIPIGGPLAKTHTSRVLFAGDAGGFVHGLTAEGIYYAMVTGELAAKAVATAAPDIRRAGPAYARAWRREVGPELADAARLQRYVFMSHDRVGRAVRALAGMPGLADMLVKYAKGESSYGTVRRHVIARFPMAALRLARQKLGEARRAS